MFYFLQFTLKEIVHFQLHNNQNALLHTLKVQKFAKRQYSSGLYKTVKLNEKNRLGVNEKSGACVEKK